MKDRERLYEKIVEISEKKENLFEENQKLKKQLNEYYENLFSDFCEFVTVITEKIDFKKNEINEVILDPKSEEVKMAKYFMKVIQSKAKEQGIDPKVVARNIAIMLKGI